MKKTFYFSVNGDYGCGAYAKPEFPELSDYVAYMNRLGISFSVVSNIESRDLSVYQGNKKLLDDINMCEEYKKRIFPAFTISPMLYYEKGAMGFLKNCLNSGKVKVLKMCPSVSRYEIFQIEQVLREVYEYKPIVLIDIRYIVSKTSYKEIAELANIFPDINFVCIQVAWGSLQSVIDLMWRCKNVHIDTSWLHVKNSIEFIVKNFGLNRILFGCGPKYHNGASIAALVHASLDDKSKEKIAFGNIMELLNMDTKKILDYDVKSDIPEKPLWNSFSNGNAIKDIEVIDVHTHIGPPARGWVIETVEISEQVEDVINTMDKLGITQMITSPEEALFANSLHGNIKTENEIKAFKAYKDRIFGYLVFNPFYSDIMVPEIDNLFKSGFFIGFKMLSSYWDIPFTDKRYIPVWEYANKYHLPILLHTWDGPYSTPSLLKNIAPKYPNAKFLIGHSGGGNNGRMEAEELALANNNVYLEWCGSFLCSIPWEETLERVGNNKVVFGSDTYFHNPAWELGRLLSLDIPDSSLIPILGANMRKIMDDIIL